MESVLIWTSDKNQLQSLTEILKRMGASSMPITGLDELDRFLSQGVSLVVVDLDEDKVNRASCSSLAKKLPGVPIIGISKTRIHPGMEEALATYINACLSKPVDDDEFIFLVKGFSTSKQS